MKQTAMFSVACLASFQWLAAAQDCDDELNSVERPADLDGDKDLQFTSLLQTGIQLGDMRHEDNNSVAEQLASWDDFCQYQRKPVSPQWGDTYEFHFAEGVDRSQQGQSSIVHEAFFSTLPIKRRTVLEIGADDGIAGSNSYAFEIGLGWRTILIEANPEKAQALKQNRPGAEVHAPLAVSQSSGYINFTTCNSDPISHITGVGHGCLVEKEIVQVPSEPLSAFLKDVPELDILFLDVEGAERIVLETIDFSTTTINLVSVEGGCPGSEVGDFLQSKGFVFRGNIWQDFVWTWGADSQAAPGSLGA